MASQNIPNQHSRNRPRFFIFICVASFIVTAISCAFGIYGMSLARIASEIPDIEIEMSALDSMGYDNGGNWSIFNDVGLFYDTLYPLDLECEASFLESDGRGRIQLVEAIWIYGGKWKEEMERYLDLLITELDENGVVWEVGFEQIELQRGGLGWIVSEAQEKWEVYNESNTRLDDFMRGQINHGGTIMQDYRAGYRYDSYRSRALYLKSLYEFLTRW